MRLCASDRHYQRCVIFIGYRHWHIGYCNRIHNAQVSKIDRYTVLADGWTLRRANFPDPQGVRDSNQGDSYRQRAYHQDETDKKGTSPCNNLTLSAVHRNMEARYVDDTFMFSDTPLTWLSQMNTRLTSFPPCS